MVLLREEWHSSCLEAFSSKMSTWVCLYPSAPVGKSFSSHHSHLGSASRAGSCASLHRDPCTGYSRQERRLLRSAEKHKGTVSSQRLSGATHALLGLWFVTRSPVVVLGMQNLCTFHAGRLGWGKSRQDSCFAACPLAGGVMWGPGCVLNMTQGFGLVRALQLVSCLKQESLIKTGGAQPALWNHPPERCCGVLCPESPEHNGPLETIKSQCN